MKVGRREMLRALAGTAAAGAVAVAAPKARELDVRWQGDPWTVVGADDGDFIWSLMSAGHQAEMAGWLADHQLTLGEVRRVEFWPGLARIHGVDLSAHAHEPFWIRLTMADPPPFIAEGLP